jgi:hypothetical protein
VWYDEEDDLPVLRYFEGVIRDDLDTAGLGVRAEGRGRVA